MLRRTTSVILAVCMILTLSLTCFAVTPRIAIITASINFYDEVASCTVDITAIGDSVTAIIKLWEDGSCIRTWNVSGEDGIEFNRRVGAQSGSTYYLTVDATINGNPRSRVSSTPKTCP